VQSMRKSAGMIRVIQVWMGMDEWMLVDDFWRESDGWRTEQRRMMPPKDVQNIREDERNVGVRF